MSNGPIFIGGLSFSGKTQLRLLLGTHPNIVITRRTRMWTRFYGRFGDLSRPENFERCLEAMLRNKHICALNPDPARIRVFNEESLRRGIVKAVNKIYVSLAHTDGDIDETLNTFDEVLAAIASRA